MNCTKIKAVKCPNHLLSKIHVRQDPNYKFSFTKGRVGKSIWQKPLTNDFTFYDPCKAEAEYNPLYDPHLKSFLMRKAQLNHLRKNNFITDDNEVVCSLKDFNEFRKCVHRSKLEIEAAEKRLERDEYFDDMRLKISNKVFDKIGKKNLRFQMIYGKNDAGPYEQVNPIKYGSILTVMKRRKDEQEREKREKFITTVTNYYSRLNQIEEQQRLKIHQLNERAYRKNLEIMKKQTFVSDNLRERRLAMKKAIVERDKMMREKLKKNKLKTTPEKLNVIIKCPIEVHRKKPQKNFQKSRRGSRTFPLNLTKVSSED